MHCPYPSCSWTPQLRQWRPGHSQSPLSSATRTSPSSSASSPALVSASNPDAAPPPPLCERSTVYAAAGALGMWDSRSRRVAALHRRDPNRHLGRPWATRTASKRLLGRTPGQPARLCVFPLRRGLPLRPLDADHCPVSPRPRSLFSSLRRLLTAATSAAAPESRVRITTRFSAPPPRSGRSRSRLRTSLLQCTRGRRWKRRQCASFS